MSFKLPQESGISKVIGGSESNKTEALKDYASKFRFQENKEYERKKTPEEIELINNVSRLIKGFVEKYNGTFLEIPPENIHLIDARQYFDEKGVWPPSQAHYMYSDQEIVINIDSHTQPLELAQLLVHEMIHFISFQTVILREEEKDKSKARRIGLSVRTYREDSRLDILFEGLNEAITEELTKRFDRAFSTQVPGTNEDIFERDRYVNEQKTKRRNSHNVDDISFIRNGLKVTGKDKSIPHFYRYSGERRDLQELISILYDKNKEKFKDKEEVFDLFAKAAMSGDLVPLVSLIEKTLGPGSFKQLGEETKETVWLKRPMTSKNPESIIQNFGFPDVEFEKGEIVRIAHEFGSDNPTNFAHEFVRRARESQLVILNKEMWSRLENTDSFDITPGNWEAVNDHAVTGNPDHPRDWQGLKEKMELDMVLDAPIILKKGDKLYLVSGNTRLMVARALGKAPQVLLVDVDLNFN